MTVSPRRTWLHAGSALFAVSLVTACGGGPVEEEPAGAASGSEESSPSPTAPQQQPFTIAFGGDVHFEGMLRERLDSDPDSALGPIEEVFHEADISMVNLETAVTEGGTPPSGKSFVFRAPASAYQALDSAGVDVATVANNHGMDYGEEGLRDTLDHAEEADFPVVGIGRDAEEAYAPHMIEVNGNTVAVLGATDVMNTNLIPEWTAGEDKPGLASTKNEMRERMVEAVEAAEEKADTVISYLHWGLEGDHCPLPHAPELAQDLVDAGADAVVGGHAHVLSPGGYLDGSYVHFGLGNFAFYNFSGPTAQTGVLELTMQGDEVLDDEWLPGRIQGGIPTLYEGEGAEEARTTWEGYRDSCTTGLRAEPSERPTESATPSP